jgi:hypothetical protein
MVLEPALDMVVVVVQPGAKVPREILWAARSLVLGASSRP